MTACRDYKMTRRQLLMASGAGATLLGMPVNNLIAAAGTDHAATCEHVILFWNGGGMSHIDTWDPKPGRPTQGEFEPIKTSADGIQISEILSDGRKADAQRGIGSVPSQARKAPTHERRTTCKRVFCRGRFSIRGWAA